MGIGVHVEDVGPAAIEATRHCHALGGGSRLVEQGGVGDVQTGQVRNHRLEVEQRLEATLGNLGLVGGVGGIPGRILQDVSLNDRRRDGVVISEADQRRYYLVLRRQLFEAGDDFGLRHRGGEVKAGIEDRRWHGLGDQLVQGRRTDGRQHLVYVCGSGTYVSVAELLCWLRHLLFSFQCAGASGVRSLGSPTTTTGSSAWDKMCDTR